MSASRHLRAKAAYPEPNPFQPFDQTASETIQSLMIYPPKKLSSERKRQPGPHQPLVRIAADAGQRRPFGVIQELGVAARNKPRQPAVGQVAVKIDPDQRVEADVLPPAVRR